MSGWACLFRHDTPWDALQAVIDEEVHERLLLFMEQLLDDPDLSDRDRAQAWATASLIIRRETRRAFEYGWHRLQLEALPVSSPVQ